MPPIICERVQKLRVGIVLWGRFDLSTLCIHGQWNKRGGGGAGAGTCSLWLYVGSAYRKSIMIYLNSNSNLCLLLKLNTSTIVIIRWFTTEVNSDFYYIDCLSHTHLNSSQFKLFLIKYQNSSLHIRKPVRGCKCSEAKSWWSTYTHWGYPTNSCTTFNNNGLFEIWKTSIQWTNHMPDLVLCWKVVPISEFE